MAGAIAQRYAEFVSNNSGLVIVLVLALTALVGAGVAIGDSEDAGIGQFEVDTDETAAADYVRANYGEDDTIVSQWVVREEGGDVLTRESLLAGLEAQQAARDSKAIADTLTEQGFAGIENLVGTVAYYQDETGGQFLDGFASEDPTPEATDQEPTDQGASDDGFEQPTLAEQIGALENRSDEEVEQLLGTLLDPETVLPIDEDPIEFLPRSYEPGETTADARLTLLLQVDDSGDDEEPQAAYDAQVEFAEIVDDRFNDAFVFGQGINNAASAQATGDSFAIILPFALVLVLFVLGIAYRDVIDIALAFVGIVIVMIWLAGIMGWLEIPMNQILIAVPFLLIGLSIDYALHVVMRYREAREGELDAADGPVPDGGDASVGIDRSIPTAMALGLSGVILALAAATFSTGVGFLSNVVSPLPAIRDFAVLSAGGILATFVVFGVLLPALKVSIDGFVENRLGRSRRKPAFGVESGLANRGLARIATLASSAPYAVILVALLLATGGVYGATTIDTEFNEADFLPEDPPAFTEYFPGPLQPGEYTIRDDFEYLATNFQLQGSEGQSQVLIRGDVTDGSVLAAIDRASAGADGTTIQREADGTAAIDGPHTVIREVAATNETIAAAIDERDTTGDGLPDQDLQRFYDLLFGADEEAAAAVLSRNEAGEVTSARLFVSVQTDRSAQAIAGDTRALATAVEGETDANITAVATSEIVTTAVVQDVLLETLVQAFSITLVVILVFLTILFWVRHRSPIQGALILVPVVAALAWLLGAMALLDIPFNSETAVITSLAIGLGVDYSIHAGERFVTERERRDSLEDALEATITGTGGALLASAGTTAAAFGVLALSLAPPLQRFGLVTGSAIVLAFIACVTVLPCLLVARERLHKRLGK